MSTLATTALDFAHRNPQAIAAIDADGSMTYRELARRVEAGAARLIAEGVQVGDIVGLACERSRELLVGMLAILRAGAAFLPLSARNPSERLKYMVDDAQVRVVVQDRGSSTADELGRRGVALVDAAEVHAELDAARPAGELAYVIYTSGTTGKPKGVLVEHAGLSNVAAAAAAAFDLTSGVRVLQHANIGFDASVFEIALAIGNGGTCCLAPAALIGRGLLDWVKEQRVEVAWFSPSLLAVLPHTELPDLRTIIVAGEACPRDVVARWAPGRRFFNAYGPTETTIWASVSRCRADDERPRPTIGKAIANLSCHVLDEAMQPVPAGSVGELFIGGVGVARGYLNRPDLTAQRFVRVPAVAGGGRLYRTGDLVRELPDGELDFIGRIDHQVKIRGQRLELEEVERVLADHPAVTTAIVLVDEPRPGAARLLAYVAGHAVDAAQIEAHARRWLPGFMVPAHIEVLAEFPMTSQGKIDRAALPRPAANRLVLDPPRSPTEQLLAAIWCDVLGLPTVNRSDDFFALGGASLGAIEVATRLAAALAHGTSAEPRLLHVLLTQRTLDAVAATIDAGAWMTAQSATVALMRDDAVLGELTLASRQARTPWQQVLITGASGFLGSYLVAELLATTTAQLHCLVRGRDAAEARGKLGEALDRAGVPRERWEPRIRVVLGDLASPGLGLTAEERQHLADSIDAIFHVGAAVNFLYPYEGLRASNVLGTRAVIELAAAAGGVPLHYISTLAVATSQSTRSADVVLERTPLTHPDRLHLGYTETKWVAEQLMHAAQAAGVPVSIYRPHDIGGDSRTGYWPTDNVFLCQTFEFVTRFGAAPKPGFALDLVPVDEIARAIGHIARTVPPAGEVYHLCPATRTPLTEMVEALREVGYTIGYVSYRRWVRMLDEQRERELSGLSGYSRLFTENLPGESTTLAELYREDRLAHFDAHNTTQALRGSGIVWTPVTRQLLRRYIDHFQATGFLPAPELRKAV